MFRLQGSFYADGCRRLRAPVVCERHGSGSALHWNPTDVRHPRARSLTAADLTPEQADAITDAIRQAAEHDGTGLATKADLTELRVELAGLEARLIKWMIGIVFAGAGLVIAGLRLIG